MKVGILAGGAGSRLSEETDLKPKPMVEIGERPILWHIMKHYDHYGFNEFVVALGYKGHVIKKYMVDYCMHNSNLSINMQTGDVSMHGSDTPDWMVHLVDTGLDTQTGGRIKRLIPHMGGETFMLTWGDGVSTIDLHALLEFHRSHGKLATLSAVLPATRFGHLKFEGDMIREFAEKPKTAEGFVNGAFFVLEPGITDYIDSDDTSFESDALVRLANDGQLMAYRHHGYWQCMDTIRDKRLLEGLWDSGNAPWKIWE
ncbi:MAG: glucose-1-phosphate cytidylyltransferase [Chloroflexi bacterium AL-W]|nr:glucose-1-phosphate cytidylyltransferase [Chloroflexi bacterium AL-N1]NOK71142.1 glucose-1-phosphate cytidylyltransferase [Chloroflexi bacterium AL-N10]NOK78608.1 glucose-1-phosphate cytidylyltransferase [Chloroflexi bacterium AL-N5]NOK85904.1 glucose-1-phosphate cytidylyltransferase [Chloroflexi bacterium AL-W]NOK92879.1 glucose-1-phosphate cytidylyltransferase [Chloroflexi bacterium AL-N15]